MARLIAQVGPLGLQRRAFPSTFEALLRSIVYQQLSGKAAATIYGRVVERLGGRVEPEALLARPEDELRGAGLSRPKLRAAQDLAARVLDGTVPPLQALETMPDEEVVAHVTQVRGVGVWTAQMLLIFTLGRPDVLPLGDLGVRKGFQVAYGLDGLPAPEQLLSQAEAWRPYRSAASWYLWRAADTAF